MLKIHVIKSYDNFNVEDSKSDDNYITMLKIKY